MQKINVFLDDYRSCPDDFTLAKNVEECILLLKDNKIGHLSLDHDLGSREQNGLNLVHYLVKNGLFAERITIHSANSVGGKNMYNYLKDAQQYGLMPTTIMLNHRPLPLG
jgi:predicted kinase